MSTPDNTVIPVSPVETKKDVDVAVESTPVPTENTDSTPATPVQILDGVNALCNTTLYVLTKGFYPGADAHLVNQAKEFIKEIKRDVESKRKAVSNGQKVEGL